MRRAILLVLAAALALDVQARDCPSTPAMEANACLEERLQAAEARLARQVRELMAAVPVNEPDRVDLAAELLGEAQEAWLAARDAHCRHQGYVEGGVPAYKRVAELRCRLDATSTRAAQLKLLRSGQYQE